LWFGWRKLSAQSFEIFEVEKLWDKAFVDSRPDVAAALKGAAIDKKFYEEHRNKVIEYIAEHDDELVDKYLNGETLTLEEMRKSIRKSTLSLKIVPVLAGSAFQEQGIQPLLDAVVDYLPSPIDVPRSRAPTRITTRPSCAAPPTTSRFPRWPSKSCPTRSSGMSLTFASIPEF